MCSNSFFAIYIIPSNIKKHFIFIFNTYFHTASLNNKQPTLEFIKKYLFKNLYGQLYILNISFFNIAIVF